MKTIRLYVLASFLFWIDARCACRKRHISIFDGACASSFTCVGLDAWRDNGARKYTSRRRISVAVDSDGNVFFVFDRVPVGGVQYRQQCWFELDGNLDFFDYAAVFFIIWRSCEKSTKICVFRIYRCVNLLFAAARPCCCVWKDFNDLWAVGYIHFILWSDLQRFVPSLANSLRTVSSRSNADVDCNIPAFQSIVASTAGKPRKVDGISQCLHYVMDLLSLLFALHRTSVARHVSACRFDRATQIVLDACLSKKRRSRFAKLSISFISNSLGAGLLRCLKESRTRESKSTINSCLIMCPT